MFLINLKKNTINFKKTQIVLQKMWLCICPIPKFTGTSVALFVHFRGEKRTAHHMSSCSQVNFIPLAFIITDKFLIPHWRSDRTPLWIYQNLLILFWMQELSVHYKVVLYSSTWSDLDLIPWSSSSVKALFISMTHLYLTRNFSGNFIKMLHFTEDIQALTNSHLYL